MVELVDGSMKAECVGKGSGNGSEGGGIEVGKRGGRVLSWWGCIMRWSGKN